jgi:superfamily II DNA helicase RecQ
MKLAFFSVECDQSSGIMKDEAVQQFMINKRVHKIKLGYSSATIHTRWNVTILYDTILSNEMENQGNKKTEFNLNVQEKQLYQRLKEWRRETADKNKIPIFIIATNQQLLDIIKNKCLTKESFKLVQGFGNSKIQKYGEAVLKIVGAFYESKASEVKYESNELDLFSNLNGLNQS